MTITITDRHLGGYVLGGDPATWYPDLWRFLVEKEDVSSVLDVGCGEGHALGVFQELGCSVWGVDGMPQASRHIARHDFTLGPWRLDRSVDLVWSCEFVEHVEEQYIPNYLPAFRAGALLLMTFAEPGQAGHHHVNCRTQEYWLGVLAAAGFLFDPDLTGVTRALAGFNESPWNHYRRSGLAFRRHS